MNTQRHASPDTAAGTGAPGGSTLPERVRILIIGGGAVGASIAYHLAAVRGESDVLLLERDELTSGSTWHAAGNIPTFSSDLGMLRLQKYSTELYTRLAADPEHPIAYHRTGALRLARTPARLDEFRRVAAMANARGYGYELLGADEMPARCPFIETHDVAGALWDPNDGDIDPSQLTQALARGARAAGARIVRFTRVIGIERAGAGWQVSIGERTVTCDVVVNAAGFRGAEVAAMAGSTLPMVTMEHQYLVTGSVPELEALAAEGCQLPLVRDPDDSWYLRQEKTGLILGPYERDARTHWADGVLPDDFANGLYNDDLERLEDYIESACERLPLLGTAGVQRVINGPIPYAPDGLPYIGPAYGLDGFFHACAFTFGICQAGGAGKAMAEWILDGAPADDLWSLDPRRYGAHADPSYTVARAIDTYAHEYAIAYPEEELRVARGKRVTPVHEALVARGALAGARDGWERAVVFARDATERAAFASAEPGYGRAVWFDAVGAECRTVQDRAGMLELSGFARHRVRGRGAAARLNALTCTRLPRVGRVGLGYGCTATGGVLVDATVVRLAEDDFLVVSGAAARRHDGDWLRGGGRGAGDAGADADSNIEPGDVTIDDMTDDETALVIAGPASRALLATLSDASLDNADFPFLGARRIRVAGIEVLALRVSYLGELGWELHVAMGDALALHGALREAGDAHGLGDVGMYAMESMRLEKGYPAWKMELGTERSPFAAGLGRFVALDKGDFVGRAALVAAPEPAERLVQLVLDGEGRLPMAHAPVLAGGRIVGEVTSAGHGHRTGLDVVLAYVRTDAAAASDDVCVDVFGTPRPARVSAVPVYDPAGARLRG